VYELIKQELLRWMRVPPEPEPPAGSPASTKVFRAGTNFYMWSLVRWALTQAALFIPLFFALFFSLLIPARGWLLLLLRAAEAFAILSYLAQLILTYLVLRLNYEMRWYIVTDRSLRIRAGIWVVDEVTMTFANIQQITMEQGPLQRILGIADVKVTSAGGGGARKGPHGEVGRDRHAGYFEGVDNAAQIRDLVIERLRRYRDAGLGDPDDTPTSLGSAQDALTELRLLHAALKASH
jgi:membrane protein YdbS with pleckstrin-like domain